MCKRVVTSMIAVLLVCLATSCACGARAARYRVYDVEKSVEEILILLGAGVIDQTTDPMSPASEAIERIKTRLASAEELSVNPDEWIRKLKQLYQSGSLTLDEISIDRNSIELYVDDEKQTSLQQGVVRALVRVAQFIDDEVTDSGGERNPGSVRLKYAVRISGLLIQRETFVEDGHLVLTTSVHGQLGRLDVAALTLDAKEFGPHGSSTHVVGTLTAHAPIGHCRNGPVTRYAERIMADRIDDLL